MILRLLNNIRFKLWMRDLDAREKKARTANDNRTPVKARGWRSGQ